MPFGAHGCHFATHTFCSLHCFLVVWLFCLCCLQLESSCAGVLASFTRTTCMFLGHTMCFVTCIFSVTCWKNCVILTTRHWSRKQTWFSGLSWKFLNQRHLEDRTTWLWFPLILQNWDSDQDLVTSTSLAEGGAEMRGWLGNVCEWTIYELFWCQASPSTRQIDGRAIDQWSTWISLILFKNAKINSLHAKIYRFCQKDAPYCSSVKAPCLGFPDVCVSGNLSCSLCTRVSCFSAWRLRILFGTFELCNRWETGECHWIEAIHRLRLRAPSTGSGFLTPHLPVCAVSWRTPLMNGPSADGLAYPLDSQPIKCQNGVFPNLNCF